MFSNTLSEEDIKSYDGDTWTLAQTYSYKDLKTLSGDVKSLYTSHAGSSRPKRWPECASPPGCPLE